MANGDDRHDERAFILALLDDAKSHGIRADQGMLGAVVRRALTMKDAGTWTGVLPFMQGLRKAAPGFFVDSVEPAPSLSEEPTPRAPGGVTTRLVGGELHMSYDDAKNTQLYRLAKARAEALHKTLVVDPVAPDVLPMRGWEPGTPV